MQQARRRDLREALQFKFWNRAAAENRPLLEEAIAIREQIAVTLGYPTWADYAMEVKMAKTPAAVAAFYESIVPGLTAKAQGELETMSELFEADYPGETLASWDWTFYHNEQKKGDFGVDANEVAAYFPLDEVVAGMFDVTGDVFELEYHRVDDAKAWHPDVALYEIRDRGSDQTAGLLLRGSVPSGGQVRPRRGLLHRVRRGARRRDVSSAGRRNRRQLHQTNRRSALAAQAQRGVDPVA